MTTRMIAPMLALAALATAQGAQAQQQACVNAADFADGVIYAMPLAFDATRTACANRLDRSGFIATRGDAYIADFRAGQNRASPRRSRATAAARSNACSNLSVPCRPRTLVGWSHSSPR